MREEHAWLSFICLYVATLLTSLALISVVGEGGEGRGVNGQKRCWDFQLSYSKRPIGWASLEEARFYSLLSPLSTSFIKRYRKRSSSSSETEDDPALLIRPAAAHDSVLCCALCTELCVDSPQRLLDAHAAKWGRKRWQKRRKISSSTKSLSCNELHEKLSYS